jgi:tRNA (guanine9-N1)-methyltransferase
MASEADSSTISTTDVVPPMSKNAMKKAAKAKFFAEIKAERRVKEKERKKEKKRQLAERREAGELDEEDEAQLQRMAKKRRLGQKNKETFQARIVFDMGFDEMMADKVCAPPTSGKRGYR